jgi:hypothetical protein
LAPEARFDVKGDGDVFVPFDLTVGRKVTPDVVVSVQGDIPIVEDYEQYDWQVEARVVFFF